MTAARTRLPSVHLALMPRGSAPKPRPSCGPGHGVKGLFAVLAPLLVMALFVTVATASSSCAVLRPLRIAILVPNATLAYIGNTYPIVGTMWENFIQTQGQGNGIGNTCIKPELLYLPCGTTTTLAIAATKKAITVLDAVVIIAPAGAVTTVVAQTALKLNPHILVMSGQSAGSEITTCQNPVLAPCKAADGSPRFGNLVSILTPPEDYFLDSIPLPKFQGYNFVGPKTAAVISLNGSAHLDVCIGGGVPTLINNGYDVVYQTILPYNGIAVNTTREAELLTNIIQDLNVLQPDLVLYCERFTCGLFQSLMALAGYTPKALGMFECGSTLPAMIQQVGELARYFFSPAQWHQGLQGQQFDEPPSTGNPTFCNMFPRSNLSGPHSPAMFGTEFDKQPNATKNPYNAWTAAFLGNLYVVCNAALVGNCTDPACILAQAQRVNQASFFGQLSVNKYGNNPNKQMVNVQPDINLVPQIITPIQSQTAQFLFPMPTLEERTYVHQMFALPQERAVMAMSIFFCACGLLAIIYIFLKRDRPEFKRSSVPFSILQLTGFCMSVLAILTWPVENDETTCKARIPLGAIGIALYITPLTARTWRVAEIFRDILLNSDVEPDRKPKLDNANANAVSSASASEHGSTGKNTGAAQGKPLQQQTQKKQQQQKQRRTYRSLFSCCCKQLAPLQGNAKSQFKVIQIPDRKLFVTMCFYAAPILFFAALWIIFAPLQVVVYQPVPFRPLYNYAQCTSTNALLGMLFGSLTLAAIAYVILLTLYYAWLVHQVLDHTTFDQFSEAREIASSLYVLFFSLIVIVGAQSLLDSTSVTLEARSGLLIARFFIDPALCVSTLILYFPRFWATRSDSCRRRFACCATSDSSISAGPHSQNHSSDSTLSGTRNGTRNSTEATTSSPSPPPSPDKYTRSGNSVHTGNVYDEHDVLASNPNPPPRLFALATAAAAARSRTHSNAQSAVAHPVPSDVQMQKIHASTTPTRHVFDSDAAIAMPFAANTLAGDGMAVNESKTEFTRILHPNDSSPSSPTIERPGTPTLPELLQEERRSVTASPPCTSPHTDSLVHSGLLVNSPASEFGMNKDSPLGDGTNSDGLASPLADEAGLLFRSFVFHNHLVRV